MTMEWVLLFVTMFHLLHSEAQQDVYNLSYLIHSSACTHLVFR